MNKYFLPVYHSQLKPWIKWWILKRLNGGQSSLKAVTISSGTLTKVDKSKALSIKQYYGNTVQNGTPTPESPVEIQTISGDNSFSINNSSYRVDFGGDNLLPQDKYIASTEVNGITYTNNGDGTFSLSGTASANTTIRIIPVGDLSLKTSQAYYLYSSQAYNSTSFNMSIVLNDSGTNRYLTANGTLTTPSSFTQARLQFYIASGNTVNVQNIKLMLVEGNTAPSRYSPYVENPIELCKIGDFEDKIYNDNGTWKIEKNIGKIVLNGSENWVKRSDISTITTSCFRTDYSSEVSANMVNGTILLSNMFTCLNNTNDVEHFRYIGAVNYRLQLFINKSRLSSDNSTGLKTWLSTHNTTVYYPLATPTYETITNTNLISGLNALYEFYVNSSKVTISNNSEIPLEVLLEYYGR